MNGNKKPVIGLIGAIGAGKSAVAKALADFGGVVIAADPIGHEALTQPEILARVKEVWGSRGIIDEQGQVDRRSLGAIVFPSPVERTRLEHLVHPYIERKINEKIAAISQDPGTKFIVLDAAIMLEAGWNNVCDKLVYVDAPWEMRLARVVSQRGWTATDLENREAVQMPPEKKKSQADVIIRNDGTLEQLQIQIIDLVHLWKLQG